jgi:type III secretion system (T3SS) protein YscO
VRLPKYPLELAAELREKRVDEAARALAAACEERERAERRRVEAEERRDAHVAAARRLRSSEREALSRGTLCAADLSHNAAWERSVAQEDKALAVELSRAAAGEAGALAAERQAREQVAARRAESRLLANHRARWWDGQQKRTEAKEGEDSEEAWRCRANKPRS